jgi:hypothetical protein
VVNMEKELGFKQSFLRGHAAPVGLIEVSTGVHGACRCSSVHLEFWGVRPCVAYCTATCCCCFGRDEVVILLLMFSELHQYLRHLCVARDSN